MVAGARGGRIVRETSERYEARKRRDRDRWSRNDDDRSDPRDFDERLFDPRRDPRLAGEDNDDGFEAWPVASDDDDGDGGAAE